MKEDPSKVPEIPGEDHAECREIFVKRHPDVLLPMHREPHRKFVERDQGETTWCMALFTSMRLERSALGMRRLLKRAGPPRMLKTCFAVAMDKLHAFFLTLEYFNMCEFTFKAGPLKYLAEPEECAVRIVA